MLAKAELEAGAPRRQGSGDQGPDQGLPALGVRNLNHWTTWEEP